MTVIPFRQRRDPNPAELLSAASAAFERNDPSEGIRLFDLADARYRTLYPDERSPSMTAARAHINEIRALIADPQGAVRD